MKNVEKSIYPIDFHSINVGEKASFDFETDDRFFEHWPESEVKCGAGKVHVEVFRHASMMDLTVRIECRLEVVCDRCLDPFGLHVGFEGMPVVRISEDIPQGEGYNDNRSDGDVLWISPMDDVLDLGQYVYESLILSLPFRRTHPKLEDCNPDMLQRFKIVTQEEFEDMMSGDRK